MDRIILTAEEERILLNLIRTFLPNKSYTDIIIQVSQADKSIPNFEIHTK